MTHNIPIRVATYLCHNHYMSLPGYKVEWTSPMMGIEKCIVCGHKAGYDLSSVCLRDEELARFLVIYFNEVDRKYKITQEGVQEIDLEKYYELTHRCCGCGFPLTIVRPGKYQCETPWCPSNQKEETK